MLTLEHFSPSGQVCYANIFNPSGQCFAGSTTGFITYNPVSSSGSVFGINLVERSDQPNYYYNNLSVSASIFPANKYIVEVWRQNSSGTFNRQVDRLSGTSSLYWTGTDTIDDYTLLSYFIQLQQAIAALPAGSSGGSTDVSVLLAKLNIIQQELYSLKRINYR